MIDTLEYIDRFFKGDLSPEEKLQFEQRIQEDPSFAAEVAFYAGAMQTISNDIAEEKKKRFKEIYQADKRGAVSRPVRKLWPYMAAAAVVVGVILGGYLLFFRTPSSSPQQLADAFMKEELQSIGVEMSPNQDSLQQGKNLYNEGKIDEALQRFESLVEYDSSNIEATKLAGIASLRLQQYDKALNYFIKLENYPGLYANPGKFYHALTLLNRNQAGDEEAAKQLLQQVVEKDLDKREVAEEWLKKW